MRDPARPPEPMPIAGPLPEGNDDTFVIQEHHARALHWDVRLERDGVLVSWAVPKALPLSSKDNRLAVHTEDHPIDYGTFEGEIPAGEYGGGHVILRVRGRYELEKWTDREVKVVLHGSRTEGRYVFFQIRGRDWMVHRMDGPPFAGWEPLPTGLRPMLATRGPLPSGGQRRWAYELAWAGNRILVAVEGGRIRITGAGGQDVSAPIRSYGRWESRWAPPSACWTARWWCSARTVARTPRSSRGGRLGLPLRVRRTPARRRSASWPSTSCTGRPQSLRAPLPRPTPGAGGLGLAGDRWSITPSIPGTGRDARRVGRELGLAGVIRQAPHVPIYTRTGCSQPTGRTLDVFHVKRLSRFT
jgi:DNA ligase D-like protein (predicted 3'-phosphoesterase)